MVNMAEGFTGSNTFVHFLMCVRDRKQKLGCFACLDSLLDAQCELETQIENILWCLERLQLSVFVHTKAKPAFGWPSSFL